MNVVWTVTCCLFGVTQSYRLARTTDTQACYATSHDTQESSLAYAKHVAPLMKEGGDAIAATAH